MYLNVISQTANTIGKSMCTYYIYIRVISLVSDLSAHQTTYGTNHLEGFFTKKIFCKMFPIYSNDISFPLSQTQIYHCVLSIRESTEDWISFCWANHLMINMFSLGAVLKLRLQEEVPRYFTIPNNTTGFLFLFLEIFLPRCPYSELYFY